MVPLHEVKLEGSRDVEKLHFPVPYKAEMKLLCIKYILIEEEIGSPLTLAQSMSSQNSAKCPKNDKSENNFIQ